jgi:NAD(P)-dependent dehydrogenase (short-subunit alcohol dehydrogenase family)
MVGELLRPGLLDGLRIAVVGDAYGQAVREASRRLGAEVDEFGGAEDEAADTLVVDGADLFAADGLQGCLAGAWDATRAVVNQAFLPAGPDRQGSSGHGSGAEQGSGGQAGRGGRIVYLAPPPSAGEHADAARAGLENLARTLSIEWARHGITTVTIALGDDTTPGEAAALTAYLASPAGAYFSGCQLTCSGRGSGPPPGHPPA